MGAAVLPANAGPARLLGGEAGAASSKTVAVDLTEKYLQVNKFAVTRRSFRHAYEPYLDSDLPIFITTDVVLNAFHVLHRQSLMRLEQKNADRLGQMLQWIWGQIRPEAAGKSSQAPQGPNRPNPLSRPENSSRPGDDYRAMRERARQQARFIVAVALSLLEAQTPVMPEPLHSAVAAETERIRNAVNADATDVSADFSVAASIDYARYRPVGLYTQSERLQRFFRAMTWLQTVSLRVEEDSELLAMLMLGRIINDPYGGNQSQRWRTENFIKCYRDFRGQQAPLDLLLAARILRDRPPDLTAVRRYLATFGAHGADRLDLHASDSESALEAAEAGKAVFHILAPPPEMEAVLFRKVTAPELENRPWPSGLDLCAVLGSQTARLRLASARPVAERKALLQAIDAAKPAFEGSGIRHGFFNCLKAVLDDPEPDAPFFMQSTGWRLKNINTSMASWVQFRHTLLNTGHQLEDDGGVWDFKPQTGFVEPEPEFFSRLGYLADQHRDLLNRCGTFLPVRYQIASDLHWFADQIQSGRYPPESGPAADPVPVINAMIERTLKTLAVIGNLRFVDEDFSTRRESIVEDIRTLADNVQAGLYEQDPTYQALLLEIQGDLNYLWQEFSHICRQLEVIAHKQLRQIPLNRREENFMTTFGEALASIMLHGGDRYRSSGGNGPIVVDVYDNPSIDRRMVAAVGRCRELLVLYPLNGQEIRCRGAVAPYYEFRPSGATSPDEWLSRIDSDDPPATPSWLLPVFTTDAVVY